MTDTVNVPREPTREMQARIDAMRKHKFSTPKLIWAAALAAAPKAKPVRWQPIDTAPKDGTHIDVWREEGGLDTVFWGFPHHECGEMGQYCDSDWHSIQAPGWVCSTFHEFLGCSFNPFTHWKPVDAGPHGQPEAPKVEQEPVAKVVSAHGDPEAFGEREIEALKDLSGIPYDTPLYTHPAPSSDELLELVEDAEPIIQVLLEDRETAIGGECEVARDLLKRVQSAIAKHKGPQS